MLAPKIIHQIWLQGWDKRPAKFDANIRALHEMNPEFKFMTWDEASLRQECAKIGPKYVKKFDSYKHLISKVDYGRYVVLYNYGGISIDLDMKPLRPILDTPGLDEHPFIISGAAFPNNLLGLVNNAVFIVTAQNLLMRKLIDEITDLRFDEGAFPSRDAFVQVTTGPAFVSLFITRHSDQIYKIDNRYYEPCMSLDPECTVKQESIMDHQHELSWWSDELKSFVRVVYKILLSILRYWYIIVALILAGVYSKPILALLGRTSLKASRRK